MPEFKINRVRKILDIQQAQVEDGISFYDNLEESIKDKVSEFHKIANTFLTLDTKLSEIETKVSSYFLITLIDEKRNFQSFVGLWGSS